MHTVQGDSATPEAALWRVGRNLHRFQRIESLLRTILPSARLSGTLQQIASQIVEGQTAAKKETMGRLAEKYNKQVLGRKPTAENSGNDAEVHLSVSFSIDAPPETLRAMRSEWRRLARERNRLVHSTLLTNDLETKAGCAALCAHLDEQYELARPLLEQLENQMETRRVAVLALKELHESPQSLRLLMQQPDDA